MAEEREEVITEVKKEGQGLSSSTLKLIAIVTMFIDHAAAVIVIRILSSRGIFEAAEDPGVLSAWMREGNNLVLYCVYVAMRQIGRIAFPIYCFMLVEGLQRTRNVWKYLMRLGIFALVSEIPFDLAFNGKVMAFSYQNVFFTLFIGLLTITLLKLIGERTWNPENRKLDIAAKVALTMLVSAAGMAFAELLKTDYAWMGVACILTMYFLRGKKWQELLGGYIAFTVLLSEIMAFPAFIALYFYKGKKGLNLKYFFYCFYPLHLLLLYLTCVVMGLASYRAL